MFGKPTLSTSRVERWYGKLVALFVVAALLLIGVIIYFSFTKTEITIAAVPTTEAVEFEIEASEVDGVVLLTDVEGSKTVNVSAGDGSEATPVEDEGVTGKATGTVTLVNKYTKAQPLVAGTRLLSKEGVLFRTKETVTVPVGGEVNVAVEADAEGKDGDVPATTFEVVALWSGIKDKIYGTSSEPMTGGYTTTATTVVTQKDVANAKLELQVQLFETANERFDAETEKNEQTQSLGYRVETPVVVEVRSDEQDPQTGTKATQVTVTQKLAVGTVVLDKTKLESVLAEKVAATAGSKQSSVSGSELLSDAVVTISEINDSLDDATLRVEVSVPHLLKADDKKIDRNQLTSKSADQMKKYLMTFDEVENVTVKISPFWAQRSPSISDNIRITVKQAAVAKDSDEDSTDKDEETLNTNSTKTKGKKVETTSANTNTTNKNSNSNANTNSSLE